MARWPHDNSYMTAPDNQISNLWVKDAAKAMDAGIEVVSSRIFIREACTLINRMHKM